MTTLDYHLHIGILLTLGQRLESHHLIHRVCTFYQLAWSVWHGFLHVTCICAQTGNHEGSSCMSASFFLNGPPNAYSSLLSE